MSLTVNTRLEKTRRNINASLAIGLLVAASGAAMGLLATRPHPSRRQAERQLPCVDVVAINPTVFDSPVVGYGTVRPKRLVKIIPEVSGRLVSVHEDLLVGNVIRKGDLLFEIDARAYQSRVDQFASDVERLDAQLKRHRQEQTSLTERLEIAKRQEDLARQSLERERRLLEQESTTELELEAAQQRLLAQQDAALTFRSRLDMIPVLIEETQAMLKTSRAQLNEAKLNVEKTRIYCPFDARVDEIRAQASQVVTASFQIATLIDMSALEVAVAVDQRELRWTDYQSFSAGSELQDDQAPTGQLTCTVWGQVFSWTGRVTRVERVDEATRTARVVVEIEDLTPAIGSAGGGNSPTLSVGMFCRADLPARPLTDALVVPRSAVQDGQFVYVLTPDAAKPGFGQLAMKDVSILRSVGDEVLIRYGLEKLQDGSPEGGASATDEPSRQVAAGDLVVVSPLARAVEGMSLRFRQAQDEVAIGDVDRRQEIAPDAPFALPKTATVLGTSAGVR